MIIFDFDGTIADTIEEALGIINRLAPKYGFPEIDRQKAQELRGLRTREVLARVGIKARQVPKLAAELKLQLRARMERVKPIEGIPESLAALKDSGITLGILTSNSRDNVEAFLNNAGLSDCFDFLETGSPIFGKARLLRRILDKRFPVRSEEANRTIYVGDETRDVAAARRVGIRAAAVCWGANSKAALEAMKPDFLLDRPSELSEIAV